MKKHNLSLTEMLVVVGLIILLFSIGVPGTIKVMQRGELTECKGNLKQLSQATAVYLKDNKNYFPIAQGSSWSRSSNDPISEYLGESYDRVNVCPSNPDEDPSYVAPANKSITTDLNTDGSRGLKLSKVKRPQQMALFVSKDLYVINIKFASNLYDDEMTLKSDVNNLSEWHYRSRYPFVSVGGEVTDLVFTNADLNNTNKTSRIDFLND